MQLDLLPYESNIILSIFLRTTSGVSYVPYVHIHDSEKKVWNTRRESRICWRDMNAGSGWGTASSMRVSPTFRRNDLFVQFSVSFIYFKELFNLLFFSNYYISHRKTTKSINITVVWNARFILLVFWNTHSTIFCVYIRIQRFLFHRKVVFWFF